MSQAELTTNEIKYLDYINDGSRQNWMPDQKKIDAIDSLQQAVNIDQAHIIGLTIIGSEIKHQSISAIRAMAEAGRLGSAILTGEFTAITGLNTITDGSVLINASIADAVIMNSVISGARIEESTVINSTVVGNNSYILEARVSDSELNNSKIRGGPIHNVMGSTGGLQWEGGLRDTYVGLNLSTATLHFS